MKRDESVPGIKEGGMRPYQKELFSTHSAVYVKLLDDFVERGIYDEEDNPDFNQDSLYTYLMGQMRDPWLRSRILLDKVQAAVFYNITLEFIYQQTKMYLHNQLRRQGVFQKIKDAAEWDSNKKQSGWQTLVTEAESRNPGFTKFYRTRFEEKDSVQDEILWQRFLDDWKQAEVENIEMTCNAETEGRGGSVANQTRRSMQDVEDYLKNNNVDPQDFMQAWSSMSGIWNSTIFERTRKVIKIQKKYPILLEIANKMGRVAAEDSHSQLAVSSGRTSRLSHSSKSDVFGVTVGDDLGSMLPLEMAQAADDELSDLFLYKYASKRLQTFSYRSEIFRPINSLRKQPAKRKGPMIVCLDTSGSMVGEPEKISNSLLLKLLELADRQKRSLYLLSFAVSVFPVDVKKERSLLFDFFKKTSSGDTNAQPMMLKMFELLQHGEEYMSSDVLWISDFKIPLAESSLLEQMQECRRRGTRMYGLQIGPNDSCVWDDYFDEKHILIL